MYGFSKNIITCLNGALNELQIKIDYRYVDHLHICEYNHRSQKDRSYGSTTTEHNRTPPQDAKHSEVLSKLEALAQHIFVRCFARKCRQLFSIYAVPNVKDLK